MFCIRKRLIGIATAVLLTCLPATSFPSNADTPGALLNKVIRAHGDKKALSCNSISLNIDVTLHPQKDATYNGKILVKSDLFRYEYRIGPDHLYRMGYDGAQAWLISEPNAKTAKKLDLLQVGLFKLYSLVFSMRWLAYLKSQTNQLKYGGQESYLGSATEILVANVETIGNTEFLIDAKTYLLKAIRFVFPGERRPYYEIIYDSYVDRDHIKMPGQINIFRNQEPFRNYKIKETHVCEPISDARFVPDIN
jgi:hypothetical protein